MIYLDVLTDPVVAGPHRRVQKLAEAMQERGHQPLLLLPEGIPEEFLSELVGSRIPYHINSALCQVRRPSWNSIRHNLKWARQCVSLFPRALVANAATPDFCVFNGIVNFHVALHPDVRSIPGMVVVNDTLLPRRLFATLHRLLPRKVRLVFQTPAVKQHYLGQGCYSFGDPDIMPPGVDLLIFGSTDAPGHNGVQKPTNIRLGSLCNISKRKGIADAIEATYMLGRQMPDIHFEYSVAGESLATQASYIRHLKNLAARGPVNTSVQFLRPLDQQGSATFLKSIDWLLLPSRSESFPQSVVQAQAVGTPVIAYDIPGVDDQITDGETGFLVPTGDIDSMARRLETLIHEPGRVRAVIVVAQQRVRSEFSLTRNVTDFLAIARHAGVLDSSSHQR